jgi:18S rRNA (adenine1779-N6/adenine1780-N6)-dimethyltransferase
MPKATSEKLSRAHKPAPKKKDNQASGSGNTNPLFNTARFGQHILKNAQTAQKYVCTSALYLSD